MSELDPSMFPSLSQLKALRVVDLKERLTALGLDTKGELICQGKRLVENGNAHVCHSGYA